MTGLRELPELNPNYDPPQPWRCVTMEPHECSGVVVGAVGAEPVCAAGAVAALAGRERDEAARDRYYQEHREELDAEARQERAWEGRVS